ncbi:MAG: hypothetical protein WDN23_14110 [Edaphobacter sp.]
MKLRSLLALPVSASAVFGSLTLLLAGCGGSSSNTPPPPPAAISVSFLAQPPSSLATSATANLSATVSNDTANAGVAWSATCSSSSCGSFNPATTGSGSTTAYTAPTSVPSSGNVTVTATSVTDKTKSVSATIAISATPPPPPAAILADGTYVFHASGEDSFTQNGQQFSSPYFVAGAFTIKSGAITGGEQDFMDYGFPVKDTISASGSTIVKTSDGNIQIVLNTGDTNIGVNGVETFNGTLVSGSRVLLTEFDTFASGAGSVDLQTSAAAPSGGYAFVVNGVDNNTNNQFSLGIGGVLNVSGTSLNLSSSVFDCSDGAATVVLGQPFTGGSISAPDSFGRVTITVTPNSSCQLSQIIFAGYMTGSQIQLVETTDTYSANGGVLGGTALSQGNNTGKFSAASVGNADYVFSAFGADGNGELTLAGGLIFNPGGTLSGVIALNDLVIWGGANITGGSYVVDPTGRVTLSNIATTGTGNSNPFTLALQVYLDGNGNALELGVDPNEITTGQAYLQTNGTFPSSGNFGLRAQGFVPVDQVGDVSIWSAVGPMSLAAGAFTGIFDYNLLGNTLLPAQSLNATVNTSTGVISTSSLDFNGNQNGFGYYVIDGSRILAIEVNGAQLGLLQIEPVKTP